jgi:hypothetical protein
MVETLLSPGMLFWRRRPTAVSDPVSSNRAADCADKNYGQWPPDFSHLLASFYACAHSDGAGVGDLFMSLIHTCELNAANPFDYLTELLRHSAGLKQRPSEWMPWNYRDTLARFARPAAA